MEEKIILPQNTRLMGALLGFIGGGLDVFCHMHYRSLVATQTGNLLLLIADWHDPNVTNTIMRFSSIFFFSIGFLVALHIKEYRKTAFWRTKMLIPLFVVTLLIPLVSWMPPFTGTLIENHPYVIFMTSGNYRKMLTALYRIARGEGDLVEYRRQAMNYGIVVGSFVGGAVSVAFVMHFIHQWSIWLITINLFLIMTYYTARVKQLGLQTDNL